MPACLWWVHGPGLDVVAAVAAVAVVETAVVCRLDGEDAAGVAAKPLHIVLTDNLHCKINIIYSVTCRTAMKVNLRFPDASARQGRAATIARYLSMATV